MNKPLPDKWIRLAVSTALNGLVVDGKAITTYDTHVTSAENPSAYILMTTQTNIELKEKKCGSEWTSSILLDIVTRYPSTGNTGSRLFADNIANEVIQLTHNLALSPESELEIVWQNTNPENDLSQSTENEVIFRKLIRLEFRIN